MEEAIKITSKQTALYHAHVQQKALMVNFAGWQMPLHYGSQIDEHNQVRNAVGMFDVSHMGIIDIIGEASQPYLSKLLANDVGKLKSPGRALYSCMLDAAGGIIDDLIVYFVAENYYRLVVNAATMETDYAWLQQQRQQLGMQELELRHRNDLAMLAIQGPQARAITAKVIPAAGPEILALRPFAFIVNGDYFISRTGYTGEDGVEIILPATKALGLWNSMLAAKVPAIGLGARDTLRLEAGLNLYGQDMDIRVTPLESNLAWTVAWQPETREFIGRKALLMQQVQLVPRQLIGLMLEDKGVLRTGYPVYVLKDEGLTDSVAVGQITSGSYSPTLKRSIGLARVNTPVAERYYVEIRGKRMLAKIIQPPFLDKAKN